ncbi:MAG: hypothetical protein IKM48_03030 [Clostridia bacterium]|nr:hypothetical protein [Clostridia bacterium]
MAKHTKNQDTVNGRISILFFGLLLFGGLLWLIRSARYRYDLIFRPMLIWLLPALFGAVAIVFGVLLAVWIRKGRPRSDKLVDLPLLIGLTVPLMAAFLLPWLTLFLNGLQFFSLATELVFYAALGGYIGYIAYCKLGSVVILPAAGMTLNVLTLYYFYSRHLSPTSMFLNTEEYHYLSGQATGLLLIALLLLTHVAAGLLLRKSVKALPAWAFYAPAGLTVILLALHAFIELAILPIRITVFGGMGLIVLWFILWSLLKKRKKL